MNINCLFSVNKVSKVCCRYPYTSSTKEMFRSYFLRCSDLNQRLTLTFWRKGKAQLPYIILRYFIGGNPCLLYRAFRKQCLYIFLQTTFQNSIRVFSGFNQITLIFLVAKNGELFNKRLRKKNKTSFRGQTELCY